MEPCQGYKEKLILDAYGELDQKERSALEEHMRKCEGCRRERERVSRFRESMKESMPVLSSWTSGIGISFQKDKPF